MVSRMTRRMSGAVLAASVLGLAACGPSTPEEYAKAFVRKLADGDAEGALKMTDGQGNALVEAVLREKSQEGIGLKGCEVGEAEAQGEGRKGSTNVKVSYTCEGDTSPDSISFEVLDGKILLA